MAAVSIGANTGTVEGTVLVPGGRFMMGSEDRFSYAEDGEGPVREVEVDDLWVDACVVTNEAFGAFVDETGYLTEAQLFGWSFVFAGLLPDDFRPTEGVVQAPWWRRVVGADWRHPEGPQSLLDGRADHPVVHVSWNDAQAYCGWSGKRLPTEAEWERAARGGLEGKIFPWGDESEPGGEHRMNVWQGDFPRVNTLADGYYGLAPADAFQPNGFGLYNATGNVWEWTGDWFQTFHDHDRRTTAADGGTHKVQKGGSHLCNHA